MFSVKRLSVKRFYDYLAGSLTIDDFIEWKWWAIKTKARVEVARNLFYEYLVSSVTTVESQSKEVGESDISLTPRDIILLRREFVAYLCNVYKYTPEQIESMDMSQAILLRYQSESLLHNQSCKPQEVKAIPSAKELFTYAIE